MPKYIDTENLSEHKFPNIVYDRYVSDGKPKSEKETYAYKVGYNEAISDIEQFAPAADVVEVVRCKYCKYHEDEEPGMVYCPDQVGGWVSNDFFCADGKRKD